jgi:hypothetical protein
LDGACVLACGADRARPDADLDGARAGVGVRLGARVGSRVGGRVGGRG